jgi:hypothetical protein
MTSPTALSLKIRIFGLLMVERLTHCHIIFNNKNRKMLKVGLYPSHHKRDGDFWGDSQVESIDQPLNRKAEPSEKGRHQSGGPLTLR